MLAVVRIEGPITFRPLTAGDLSLLGEWLAEPAVRRWWNHDPAKVDEDFGPSVRGEERGEDLVVLVDGEPVGLLQRSRVADYPEDLDGFGRFVEVPEHAIELDYLLGDASVRGQGLGPRMLAAAVEDTWTAYPEAPAVLVAVVEANRASWRALEKAGFRRVAEGDLEPDNPIDDPLHVFYRVDRPG